MRSVRELLAQKKPVYSAIQISIIQRAARRYLARKRAYEALLSSLQFNGAGATEQTLLQWHARLIHLSFPSSVVQGRVQETLRDIESELLTHRPPSALPVLSGYQVVVQDLTQDHVMNSKNNDDEKDEAFYDFDCPVCSSASGSSHGKEPIDHGHDISLLSSSPPRKSTDEMEITDPDWDWLNEEDLS